MLSHIIPALADITAKKSPFLLKGGPVNPTGSLMRYRHIHRIGEMKVFLIQRTEEMSRQVGCHLMMYDRLNDATKERGLPGTACLSEQSPRDLVDLFPLRLAGHPAHGRSHDFSQVFNGTRRNFFYDVFQNGFNFRRAQLSR